MNVEEYRSYCLSKEAVAESFPFDGETLVFKVAGKIFALANVDLFSSINLKCDPERAVELRELFDGAIVPGYHMNKRHWNTITVDGRVGDKLLFELIDHSYFLIVKSLPKKIRQKYQLD
ncbi:MAG: putative DNA-binding protein (MmcQ/YjbR family) [Marivirga sp.]|jgi:predicted DNA-binding protein (MmcQ/YjbR family)